MRFYCHCLNVCIDVLETNDDPQILSRMNIRTPLDANDLVTDSL